MDRSDKVYIKLELEKNQPSDELLLLINFDKNAPNLFTENNMIRWSPTPKEIEFMNQAFDMFVSNRKRTEPKDMEDSSLEPTVEHDVGDTVLIDRQEHDVVERVMKRKKQG